MNTYENRIDTLIAADTAAQQRLTDRTAEVAIALVEATARAIIRHGTSEYNYGIHRQAQLNAALSLAELLVPDSWSHQTLSTAWQQLTHAGYIEKTTRP